ncbi:hypothetical protein J2T13_004951 [Paenibacillus sp. DS2015]|uniref:hypothetical protein n=1 Tax=Paenibacillus sp. DS2015 TaxID=3373917 RepID=UPI003D1B5B1F
MVKVKTTMNKSALNKLSSSQIQALTMTADAVKTDIITSEVVPKQTGELERSSHLDDSLSKRGLVKLVFDTPYGRRLYWHPEYNFRMDKNSNAKGKWLEAWISGEKKNFAKKTFCELYRRINRGVIK